MALHKISGESTTPALLIRAETERGHERAKLEFICAAGLATSRSSPAAGEEQPAGLRASTHSPVSRVWQPLRRAAPAHPRDLPRALLRVYFSSKWITSGRLTTAPELLDS